MKEKVIEVGGEMADSGIKAEKKRRQKKLCAWKIEIKGGKGENDEECYKIKYEEKETK